MNAEQTVKNTIERHMLIGAGDHVILGLSGGADSLCLLHILAEFRKELGFSLSCVHLNHLMRGEKAQEDARWLTEHCEELGLPLDLVTCDVRAVAKEKGISVEEAGRIARQDALFGCAKQLKPTVGGSVLIAFAHNRDDQAETVLMRVLRGTGVHGLAAMEYRRADGIIRPLLDTSRKAVEAYCTSHKLDPRWDYTNASKEFTRNKLRLELLPLLAKNFNPAIKDGLVRLSNNAREDDSFLEKLAAEKIDEAVFVGKDAQGQNPHPPILSYKLSDMASLDPAVGKRVIKLLFSKLGLREDIAYTHLQALWEAIDHKKHGTQCAFPQNYKAEIAYDMLLFYKEETKEAVFENAWNWSLKQRSMPVADAPDPKSLSVFNKVFDAEKIRASGAPLCLRTRLPGDYIQPMGLSGTKKLQDYFVDAKVARAERDFHPLICMGPEVLWIFQGPINDKYKVTDETRIVLLLELQQGIC